MKEFTGFEYLLIDLANNNWLGSDKLPFEERIHWALGNIDQLESLADQHEWKQKPLFIKATQALRKAQKGLPTGHRVGLDAICSGMQIMSALTGCRSGATATGLVDPDRRADAYTDCTEVMDVVLEQLGAANTLAPVDRKDVKQAVMTSLYGSQAEPKKVFGEGTIELDAFYKAMMLMAPGACELLNDLLNSWQPWALTHEWTLPDGFRARVKSMVQQEERVVVDELNHASFTYVYYENEGMEWDRKNAANVVHSIDAYVLRNLVRRCNYDPDLFQWAARDLTTELLAREVGESQQEDWAELGAGEVELKNYIDRFEANGIADMSILQYLYSETVCLLSDLHLQRLNTIVQASLKHKPFPIITVHDDFTAHPNNLNHVRNHYRNILADLADSTLVSDLLNQLHGTTGGVFQKLSEDLGDTIRQSNYALS